MEVQFGGQVSVKKPLSFLTPCSTPAQTLRTYVTLSLCMTFCDILCASGSLMLSSSPLSLPWCKKQSLPLILHDYTRLGIVSGRSLPRNWRPTYKRGTRSLPPKDDEDYVPNLAPLHLRLLVAFICFHGIPVVSHCMAIVSIHLDPILEPGGFFSCIRKGWVAGVGQTKEL